MAQIMKVFLKMMRSAILSGFALSFMLSLSACNTVAGIGRDLQSGGERIERAANR